jgi:hypothetical protein
MRFCRCPESRSPRRYWYITQSFDVEPIDEINTQENAKRLTLSFSVLDRCLTGGKSLMSILHSKN